MTEVDEVLETDVLVVGGGGAGIVAAIESAKPGIDVTLAVKGLIGHSGCTPAALGGIAGFYVRDPRDSWWQHFEDTVIGGAFLSDQALVEVFSKDVPMALLALEEWGCIFDRDDNGGPYLRQFGGHTYRRSVGSGDRSGTEMIKGLKARLFKSPVRILDELSITRLLTDEQGEIVGATALDIRSGKFLVIKARAVILATGGMGRVFPLAYTADWNVGDGYYMAMLAGAKVIDLEMLQWHPTAIWWPPGLRGMAGSEALRSEGGRLYNKYGERFMMKYSPEWLEVATRDFVSRSIYREYTAGNATANGGVYLSLTHIPADIIEKRLPTMFSNILSVGIDLRTEPVEITPAAHYTDGGVVVNVFWESEDVSGLYAAGEVSGGIHGGNRLGSNSLPDLMVTGTRAGQAASIRVLNLKKMDKIPKITQDQVREERLRVFAPLERRDGISPLELRDRHLDIMWQYLSVIRDEKGLKKLVAEMDAMWNEELPKVSVSDRTGTWNYEWLEALDLYPRLFMGQAMALSALMRTESRANHYREDYPDTDNKNWLKNTEVSYDPSGSTVSEMIKTSTRPIRVTLLTPEAADLPGLKD